MPADNTDGLKFYEWLGFQSSERLEGYYAASSGTGSADALVLRKQLESPEPIDLGGKDLMAGH